MSLGGALSTLCQVADVVEGSTGSFRSNVSDASTERSSGLLSVGSLIAGRYEIVSEIGRGGMSVVFHCVEAMLDRHVAVKVFNFGEDESDFFERFQKEARAISSLTHPNIVRVFASGIDGRHPYIVMELLQGLTLEELLKQGPLEPSQFSSIFCSVIEAVAHAHAHNIVHRDLKPANIMLPEKNDTANGVVKILDFSVAKILDDHTGASKTVGLAGTPYYMSPEQCAGAAVDARSDIYSLGCLMYECITGSKPFEGDTAFKIMYGHTNEPAPPFGDKGNSRLYSASLKLEVLKCLSKKVEDRPQKALLLKAFVDQCQASPGRSSLGSFATAKFTVCVLLAVTALIAIFFIFQPRKTNESSANTFQTSAEVKPINRMRMIKDRLRDNRTLVTEGRLEEAAKEYSDIIRRCQATNKGELQEAYRDAAHCYVLLGRKEEAFALLRKRLAMPDEAPPGSEREAEFTNELAWAYYKANDFSKAIDICKKYIEAHESNPSSRLNMVSTYDSLASYLISAGRSKEAIPYAKTCLTICNTLPKGRTKTEAINSTRLYYMACSQAQVDMDDAEKELQATMKIVGDFKGAEAGFRMVAVAKLLGNIDRYKDGFHFLEEARKTSQLLPPFKKADLMVEIDAAKMEIEARRATQQAKTGAKRISRTRPAGGLSQQR